MKEWFENKSVAIVGNAMSLFDKEYGIEIDSHSVIVRLNKAAMLYERFDVEKSHGKRTDVWMFWRTAEYKRLFSSIDKNIKKMHMGHQDRNNNDLKMADFVYPDTLHKTLKKSAGKHNNPTTGLMALDYIVSCNAQLVSVYGYDWKETPTYTDPTRKKDKSCPHDFETEKQYCADVFFTQPHILLRK